MNFSVKELRVIEIIKETMEAYGDGFSDVMFEDIVAETKFAQNTVKGVLGRLIQRGIVDTMDVNREYNVYYLTKTAIDLFEMEVAL
jgi:predicted transcriptional regulator